MAAISCTCVKPAFGNLGKPSCTVEMKRLAFPIFVPRFKADGTRFTFDITSSTIGQILKDALVALDPENRIYPMLKVNNPTFDRTETAYQTDDAGEKFRLDGEGNVRTINMMLWGDSAVPQMMRELKKYGCSELDVLLVDVGNIWGIKDDEDSTTMRGFALSKSTFDVFKGYAVGGAVQSLNVSFDLEKDECEENAYAITNDELTYKATTLVGLQTAHVFNVAETGVVTTVTSMTMEVHTGYGTAGTRKPVTGLTAANTTVTVTNAAGVSIAGVSLVETAIPGTYTFDYTNTTIGAGLTTVSLSDGSAPTTKTVAGFEVTSNTFTASA